MLDYAQGGRGFETAWVSGGAYRTALSFYPGRASLRAVAVNGVEALGSCDAVALTLKALGEPLLQLGERIAANALQPVQPLWCANAQLLYVEGQWLVGWPTGQSQAAPVPAVIADDEAWRLLALSGGTPLALFGEWECGPQLGRWRLLSAWQQDAQARPYPPSGRTKERCDEQRQFVGCTAAVQSGRLGQASRACGVDRAGRCRSQPGLQAMQAAWLQPAASTAAQLLRASAVAAVLERAGWQPGAQVRLGAPLSSPALPADESRRAPEDERLHGLMRDVLQHGPENMLAPMFHALDQAGQRLPYALLVEA
jgi:hypothetical protein